MTLPADTTAMAPGKPSNKDAAPLASYVLRVIGRPAVLVYELHDVRTGRRRRFSRAAALMAFLAQQGLSDIPTWPPAREPESE